MQISERNAEWNRSIIIAVRHEMLKTHYTLPVSLLKCLPVFAVRFHENQKTHCFTSGQRTAIGAREGGGEYVYKKKGRKKKRERERERERGGPDRGEGACAVIHATGA